MARAATFSNDFIWKVPFGLPHSYPEAELALLLAQFENLEELQFRVLKELGPSFNSLLITFNWTNQWKKQPMPNISKLDISAHDPNRQHGIVPKGLHKIFQRGTLNVLYTDRLFLLPDHDCFEREMSSMSPGTSNIQVLHLEYTDLCIEYFLKLMKVFKQLKQLRISWHPMPKNHEPFDLENLAEALAPHSASLQKMWLYCPKLTVGSGTRLDSLLPVDSLKSFTALKVLWIDAKLISGSPAPLEKTYYETEQRRLEKELAAHLHRASPARAQAGQSASRPRTLTNEDCATLADIFPISLEFLKIMSPKYSTPRFKSILSNILTHSRERMTNLKTLDLVSFMKKS